MASTLITALGETKRVFEWSQDPRCPVSPNTLSCRLIRGWEPERAVTEPLNVRGSDFIYSKLSEDDIPEIFRKREEELWTFKELSKEYGVTTADIGYVLNGLCWQWVDHKYVYTGGRIWTNKKTGERKKLPHHEK